MTTDNFKPLQAQSFSLSGGGAIAGATSIILKSFAQIDGALITMSDLGSIAFMTLEPGNGTLEEQISFTGVVQNSNGTATLTGVSNVTFADPYTQTSGTSKTHAGSTTAILSNTSGFYNQLDSKNDDATITGKYTFPGGGDANAPVSGTVYATPTADLEYASKKYVDTVAVSGAPNANTTTKGIVQLSTQAQADAKTTTGSTGALLVNTPDLARSTLLSDYVPDTGSANAYAIAPSPTISAYTAGQIFSFKVKTTNTTASTLAVNALSATAIFKGNGTIPLAVGDLIAGQIVMVEYNGINGFQMMNPPSTSIKFGGTGTDGVLSIASGTTTIDLANAKVVTKNYSSISITGTGALAFINPNVGGTLIILKSQGNVTLTSSAAPMLDCSGLGASTDTNSNLVFDGVTHKGATGNAGSANSTSTGGAGGAAQTTVGLIYTNQDQYLSILGTIARRGINIVPGSGGGTGGSGGNGTGTTGGAGGAGGRGGGALLIECNGAFNFTTANGISVAGLVGAVGSNGSDGTGGGGNSGSGGGGGGGGGAGGNVVILYNTLTANSGTINISGGAGGTSGNGGGVAAGTNTNGGGGGGSGGTAGAAFGTVANASGAGATGANSNIIGTVGNAGGANGNGAGGASGAGSGNARVGASGAAGGAALTASGSSLVLANTEFV